MIKRTIKETVREYDEVGKLTRETITDYTYPTTPTAPLGSTTDNLPM